MTVHFGLRTSLLLAIAALIVGGLALRLSLHDYWVERIIHAREPIGASGQIEARLTLLKDAAAESPDYRIPRTAGEFMLSLATLYPGHDFTRQAALWHEEALGANPLDWVLHRDLGWLYLQIDDLETAERHLQTAMTSAPHHANAIFAMGRIREKQNRETAAAEFYRRALDLQASERFRARLENLTVSRD